jgi:hypothetical protein
VAHLVYGSAGPDEPGTGVSSWDSKVPVEEDIGKVGVPYTILRPMAFMELMTHKPFFPPVGTWRIMPKLTGEERPIPWLSVEDLGTIAAMAFDRPGEFTDKELTLASDVATLAECRSAYAEVAGRPPRTFPMPIWLFDRFTRKDATTMWRWLRRGEVPLDTGPTRAILPGLGHVRLQQLSTIDLNKFKSDLLVSGLSGRSVEYALAIIRASLNAAVAEKRLVQSPVVGVKAPKKSAREIAVWSASQLAAFFRATRGDRLHGLWVVMG